MWRRAGVRCLLRYVHHAERGLAINHRDHVVSLVHSRHRHHRNAEELGVEGNRRVLVTAQALDPVDGTVFTSDCGSDVRDSLPKVCMSTARVLDNRHAPDLHTWHWLNVERLNYDRTA